MRCSQFLSGAAVVIGIIGWVDSSPAIATGALMLMCSALICLSIERVERAITASKERVGLPESERDKSAEVQS